VAFSSLSFFFSYDDRYSNSLERSSRFFSRAVLGPRLRVLARASAQLSSFRGNSAKRLRSFWALLSPRFSPARFSGAWRIMNDP